MQLRSSDPRFLSLVDAWWQQLLPRLAPLTYARGGPIIMVQVLFQKHACCLNIHILVSAYGVQRAGKCMRWPPIFLHRHSSIKSNMLTIELAYGSCKCNTIRISASHSQIQIQPECVSLVCSTVLLGAFGIHGSCEPMVMQVVDKMSTSAPIMPTFCHQLATAQQLLSNKLISCARRVK